MSAWEMRRRLDWIDDRLTETGELNRYEIATYFGVTSQVASADIAKFLAVDPHLRYNASDKRYERKGGGTVRNSTAARRAAWGTFT